MVRYADTNTDGLLLTQNGEDFEGRITLKVINNVPLRITATVSPANSSALSSKWSVKLNEPGENLGFRANSASNIIDGLHTPGTEGNLELCVRFQGADMEWHASHRAFTEVQMARIAITVIPNP